jgi:hypothetical protein
MILTLGPLGAPGVDDSDDIAPSYETREDLTAFCEFKLNGVW